MVRTHVVLRGSPSIVACRQVSQRGPQRPYCTQQVLWRRRCDAIGRDPHTGNQQRTCRRSRESAFTSKPKFNPATRYGVSCLTCHPGRGRTPDFFPSRRPPAVAAVALVQAPPLTMTSQSLQPALSLLGIIAGDADDMESVAVFLDASTNMVIRMKPGESHNGWTLQSVRARHAILQRGSNTAR